MSKERKRINITLAADEFAAVEYLAQKGGFKNVCAFSRALLCRVSEYAATRQMSPQERPRQPTPIADEIEQMFKELIDWDAASPAQQRAAIMSNEKTPPRWYGGIF